MSDDPRLLPFANSSPSLLRTWLVLLAFPSEVLLCVPLESETADGLFTSASPLFTDSLSRDFRSESFFMKPPLRKAKTLSWCFVSCPFLCFSSRWSRSLPESPLCVVSHPLGPLELDWIPVPELFLDCDLSCFDFLLLRLVKVPSSLGLLLLLGCCPVAFSELLLSWACGILRYSGGPRLLWLEDLAVDFFVSSSLPLSLSEGRVIRATMGSLVHLGLLPDSKYSTSSAGAWPGAWAGLWRSLFPKDHRSGSTLVLVGLFMLTLRPWIPRTKGLLSNPPRDIDIYTIFTTWWKTHSHNKTSEKLLWNLCQEASF